MKAIRFLSMLLAALLVTSLCCFGAFAAEKVVFVADGGDDSAAGTSEAPVKTFAKAVEMRQGHIIVVDDIHQLKHLIVDYDSVVSVLPAEMKSNNEKFNRSFERIVNRMFMEKK